MTGGKQVSSGNALSTGLMAGGAVLGGLILLWLLANLLGGQLRAGGFIFGLMFLAAIALPLVGAGWYLRRRAPAEAEQAAAFDARRQALDRDRTVRRELARELRQRSESLRAAAGRAASPEVTPVLQQAAQRVAGLLEDVERPGYDLASWLNSAAADREQLETVRRYDDLVLEEVNRLEALERQIDGDPGAARSLVQAIDSLGSHLREREALFARGRQAPSLSAQEMLADSRTVRRPTSLAALRLDDAVTHELTDYLVRGVLTYFAGGRTWQAYQLSDGKEERWLESRAGGTALAWLRSVSPPGSPEDQQITVDGTTYEGEEGATATVAIETAAGRQEGLLVIHRSYSGPDSARAVVERWPDSVRALVGARIQADELQLWTKPVDTE